MVAVSTPEYCVRRWTGTEHLLSNPTPDEAFARAAARQAIAVGHIDVALLRRDGPDGNWIAQSLGTPPSRLVRLNGRAYSWVKGR
jgi:hypothetical protein